MTLVMGFSSWSNINKYVTIKRFGLNNGRRNSNQSITKYFWLYLLFFEKSENLQEFTVYMNKQHLNDIGFSKEAEKNVSLFYMLKYIQGKGKMR